MSVWTGGRQRALRLLKAATRTSHRYQLHEFCFANLGKYCYAIFARGTGEVWLIYKI